MSYLSFILEGATDLFFLAAIFVCPTYWLLRAFNGRGYKVGVFFLIMLSFLKLFFRVNLQYHLVRMVQMFPIIFQSRSYFSNVTRFLFQFWLQSTHQYYYIWKILFGVIHEFCTDAECYQEMGPIGCHS